MKEVEDARAAVRREGEAGGRWFRGRDRARLLKSATHEYEQAIVKAHRQAGRIPGLARLCLAGREDDRSLRALEKKDADAKHVRDGFAELKKAWPAAMAPKTPAKDYAAVLSDVSRIELSIGKLM